MLLCQFKTQTGRDCHDPFWLFSRFLFFFDLVDFASFEVSAVRADDVRQALVPAIGAGNQVRGNQRILRAAAIPASFGMFALWMWGHETFSFIHTSDGRVPVWIGFLLRSPLIIYAGGSDVKANSK